VRRRGRLNYRILGRPPTISGAALGDSNTGMHLEIGILTALIGREKPARTKSCHVDAGCGAESVPRQAARSRLDHVGYLEEYPQYLNGKFTDARRPRW
jgi:formyl-CoA transferase